MGLGKTLTVRVCNATITTIATMAALTASTGIAAPARTGAPAMSASVSETGITPAEGARQERHERQVDQAALESQHRAEATLEALLRRYRGMPQEAGLLTRLADVEIETAAVEFRVAHGRARGAGTPVDLSEYHATLWHASRTLSSLIERFPDAYEMPHSLYERGKALEEIGNQVAAVTDYHLLVTRFPQAEDNPRAYMALADIAIEHGEHRKAIGYLEKLNHDEDSPYYPFALYKLAWAYYNLHEIPRALSYLEANIAFYHGRGIGSDSALAEVSLLDATLFYLDGMEQKDPDYSVSRALSYFRKLNGGDSGKLGRMITRFAKQLRSHEHGPELLQWKREVLEEEGQLPESYEVALIVYEYEYTRRNYAMLGEPARDLVRIQARCTDPSIRSRGETLLSDSAKSLQEKIIADSKGAGAAANAPSNAIEINQLSVALTEVYTAFIQLIGDRDPRVLQARCNLAETAFATHQFERATEHYRWIVAHAQTAAQAADAERKAIASRYERLRERRLIPEKMEARAFSSDAEQTDPLLAEWLLWIDDARRHGATGLENFDLEASRALYSQGQVHRAVARLQAVALGNPRSPYAIPSASLVVDTYVASSDWAGLERVADQFLAVPAFRATPFARKLYATVSNASYAGLEDAYKAGAYEGLAEKIEAFASRYSGSEHLEHSLLLAGSAELKLGKPAFARSYLRRIVHSHSARAIKSENQALALLALGEASEQLSDLAEAAQDDAEYLKLPPELARLSARDRKLLARRTLTLAWLAHEDGLLVTMLGDGDVCGAALADDCDRLDGLMAMSQRGESVARRALRETHNGPEANRALWAAVALQNESFFPFRDRDRLVQLLVEDWGRLDPLTRSVLTPDVSRSIPRAVAASRRELRTVSPLHAGSAWIEDRIFRIRELEHTAIAASKLPLARVQAESLDEMATAYADTARGLEGLLTHEKGRGVLATAQGADEVKHVADGFQGKARDLRAHAFETGSRAAIEAGSLAAISRAYFQDRPEGARLARTLGDRPAPLELSATLLMSLDPEGGWDAALHGCSEAGACLRARWVADLRRQNWGEALYLLQDARDRKLLESRSIGLASAVLLARMGAQAEGLALLDDTRGSLKPEARNEATVLLLGYFMESLCREKTGQLLRDYQPPGPTQGQEAPDVTVARKWMEG